MKYSIVIPFYNEEESILELYKKIKKVMDKISPDMYEIIFVNDGSTDASSQKVLEIRKKDTKVQTIGFRKNQGKAAALSIGFSKAKGDYVITMDADLQDEPEEIPKLIAKMKEGYDLVSGWKENRQDGIDKTFPSKVFNTVVSYFSGIDFHDFNCGFKLYKKQVVKEITIYGQLYRFIPVLAADRGFRVAEVKVKHNKRKYGKSKYTWRRIFPGMMDLLTIMFLLKFGKRPLHLFGIIGGLSTISGTILLIYLVILRINGQTISRRPLLIFAAVLFIAGLQIIFTGLIAEMITRSTHSDEQYPLIDDDFV